MRPEEYVNGNGERQDIWQLNRPDVSQEALGRSAPAIDRMISGVRAVDEWYAADFARRLSELTGLLKEELAKKFNEQLAAELQSQGETLRNGYEERFYAQSMQWESERQSLKQTVADLQQRVPGPAFFQEIDRVEAEIATLSDQLRSAAASDAVPMSQVLQLRMEQTEAKAYLRGLKTSLALANGAEAAAGEPGRNREAQPGMTETTAVGREFELERNALNW